MTRQHLHNNNNNDEMEFDESAIHTSAIAQMDDADAALIVQILLQDGQEAISSAEGNGKRIAGDETDAQVAFNLYLEEVERAQGFIFDKRMTRSIQQAILVDSDAISSSQAEEHTASHDHDMSVAMSNGETPSSDPDATFAAESAAISDDYELFEKLLCIYVNGIEDDESDGDSDENDAVADQPESSTWAASRRSTNARQRRACIACGDRKHFAQLAKAPCNHEYCRECFSRLFRDAMVDESLFPPRCCKQSIRLDKSRFFLNAEIVQQFRKKAIEFSTPNRTYCHRQQCAVFIPPDNCTGPTALCEECGHHTCTTCKGASHSGDCPNDGPLQHVIELAREQGWQRCQNCWGMVELNTGCNHMTCRCGFQFCYVCGAQWKTCRCEQWDERRLYERAAEIDARDEAPDDVAPVPEEPNQREPIGQHVQEQLDEVGRDTEPNDDDINVVNTIQATSTPQEAIANEEIDHNQIEPAMVVPEPPANATSSRGNRQQRLESLMQTLRYNHECSHERWSRSWLVVVAGTIDYDRYGKTEWS
ncbi:hypothetical protein LQW54_005232 [Pestalotiopsis sp. IQ-011]